MKNYVCRLWYTIYNSYVNEVVIKQRDKIIKENSKKLEKLINIKFGTLAKYNVFNLSNRKLTKQENFALKKNNFTSANKSSSQNLFDW